MTKVVCQNFDYFGKNRPVPVREAPLFLFLPERAGQQGGQQRDDRHDRGRGKQTVEAVANRLMDGAFQDVANLGNRDLGNLIHGGRKIAGAFHRPHSSHLVQLRLDSRRIISRVNERLTDVFAHVGKGTGQDPGNVLHFPQPSLMTESTLDV